MYSPLDPRTSAAGLALYAVVPKMDLYINKYHELFCIRHVVGATKLMPNCIPFDNKYRYFYVEHVPWKYLANYVEAVFKVPEEAGL